MRAEEALYYRDRGDTDAALRSIAGILAIGGAIAGHPNLIFYLTASSIDSMAFDSLQNLMARNELTDDQLVTMQQTFREAEGHLTLAPAILGEALIFKPTLDMMVSQFPAFLMDPAEDYDKKELPADIASLAGLLVYRYSGVVDSDYLRLLQGTRHGIALCALPPNEAIQRVKEPVSGSIFGSVFEISRYVVDMTFDLYGNLFLGVARTEARFRIVNTALAVERYRLEYDRLPERLEELVPAYLAAVPLDPFDGQPLRYQREDGRFAVYSIGPRMGDNGGYDFQERESLGDDIVFSVLRRETPR